MEEVLGEEEEAETGDREPAEATLKFERGSLFFSSEYENLNRDVTTFEDGYSSDKWQLTVGADAQLTKRSLVGVALVGSDQSGNFDGGGHFDAESFGVLVFGSFLPTDRAFIQVSGGFFDRSNEKKRVATFESDDVTPFSRTGRPDSDYDADEFSAGALVGYDQPVGRVTISPRAGLDWVNTAYDTYSETGDSGLELTFHDDEQTSLQSTVGLLTTVPFSTDFGVMTLQGAFDWKHEFDQKQRDVEVSFVGDTRSKRFTYETEKPDEDFFEFNGGFSMVLPNGIQPYGNFRALLGHKYFDNYAVAVGLRIAL